MIQLPFPSLLSSFLSIGKCHNGRISLSDKPSSRKVTRPEGVENESHLAAVFTSYHAYDKQLFRHWNLQVLYVLLVWAHPLIHLPTYSLGHSHSPITADYKRVTVVRPSSVR